MAEEKNIDIKDNVTDAQPISMMKDFEDPKTLYEELIRCVKKYHPSADLSMIEKAYRIADDAHKGQVRKSGEPYIIHPLCVSIILANLELDKETIVAGLLHDVVEDTVMTDEEIKKEFSEEVALLVDGVTKLGQINFSGEKKDEKEEIQAENLRKMFLAMAKDIRVILIKLADRLHNMRTLKYMKPEKQQEKARETMDIYAPIAQRLGISKIKVELDDLSLKYLEADAYKDLVEKVAMRKSVRDEFVQKLVEEVRSGIEDAGIKGTVYGRSKHFFSIYKKMVNQDKTIDQIYDLFAIRILVNDIKDCYAALGVIHEMFKPVPGRFKDYIAMPKPNMYQSLHTTLIGPDGKPFEIQIRTYDMHRTAEYGIAAHWKYKESANGNATHGEEAKLSWLKQILEWQQDMSDNKEFMTLLKSDLDLFSDSVFAFTPSGDVKNLPNGSNPVDFAYSIHSAVGNKMVGAKANGKIVPFDYIIQNGDRIEIITSQNSKGPSRDWLSIVKSTQAKTKINQWFRSESRDENISRGKELVEKYCKTKGISWPDLNKEEYKEKIIRKYGFHDWDNVMSTVGHGGLKESQVVNRMLEEHKKLHPDTVTDADVLNRLATTDVMHKNPVPAQKSKSGIVVKGLFDISVHLSKCCSPVPGDEIVGFVTRGRGVSIHRTDCVNMINLPELEKSRLIEAEWDMNSLGGERGVFVTEIKIFGNNRTGLLVDISRIFTEKSIDIKAIHSTTSKQGIATIIISFETKGKEEIAEVVGKLNQVDGIIEIERTRG